MRDLLEQLLRTADVLTPERAQLRWGEYRTGADSPDAEVKRRADAAFATLLACYGGAIYRHIWGFVRSDAAEDVFQDVLKTWHVERLNPRLADVATVLPWLREVAANKCRDALRRTTRRRAREAREARPEATPPAESPDELQELIRVALSKLDEKQRQAVALHYFEGLDKQDAAATLGIDRKTFAKRLDDALARLQKLVPAPVVLASCGTAGVPAVLAAKPPSLTAARLSELASGAWAKAAAPGWSFAKVATVAAALVLGSGLAVGGWALTREQQPNPEPAPPRPRPNEMLETFQEKYRRLAENDVVPKLLAVLQGLVLGGGEVTAELAEPYDTRLDITVVLKHRVEHNPGWVSRARFIHDIHTRRTIVMLDYEGTGRYRLIDLAKPVVLAEDPLFGKRLTVSFAPLTRSLEVFSSFSVDERSAAIAAEYRARLREAFAPYLGTWYRQGDPGRVCVIQFHDTGPRMINDKTFWLDGFEWYRLTQEGSIQGLMFHGSRVDFRPDGRRIDFPQIGEWWAREPANGR